MDDKGKEVTLCKSEMTNRTFEAERQGLGHPTRRHGPKETLRMRLPMARRYSVEIWNDKQHSQGLKSKEKGILYANLE